MKKSNKDEVQVTRSGQMEREAVEFREMNASQIQTRIVIIAESTGCILSSFLSIRSQSLFIIQS